MAEKKTYQPEILLIQDDPFLSDIYKQKFEMEGFKTTIAESGESAMNQLLKKRRPSIILLDVQMPKIDGFELLKEIKERKRTRDIPVVLLTSIGQKEDVERGFALGAEDYVIKTHFKPTETLNTVKHILQIT